MTTSSRVQILETGDLLIAAVREKDAGHYTCVRSNEAGEVRGSANLSVLGKPKTYIVGFKNIPIILCLCLELNILYFDVFSEDSNSSTTSGHTSTSGSHSHFAVQNLIRSCSAISAGLVSR